MPILGLTDQQSSFPRIGVLRKGDVKPADGKSPGKDLDYFRLTADDPSIVEAFHAAFGQQPRAVNCFLPFATVDENFQAWREAWRAGGLLHRCDGETTVITRQDDGSYATKPVKCPGAYSVDNKDGCKPVGRLTIWIPEFARLAFIVAQTTSKHDILELSRNLRAIALLRPDLRGVPMVLRRRPREISVPGLDQHGRPSRQRRVKWLLTIEPAQQWVSYQLAAMERAALPEGAPMLALPAPSGLFDDDEDESTDVGAVVPVAVARPTNGTARAPAATQRVIDGNEPVLDYTRFWIEVKALGVDNAEAHKILGVASVKDYVARGGTLDEALGLIRQAKADTEFVDPPDAEDPGFSGDDIEDATVVTGDQRPLVDPETGEFIDPVTTTSDQRADYSFDRAAFQSEWESWWTRGLAVKAVNMPMVAILTATRIECDAKLRMLKTQVQAAEKAAGTTRPTDAYLATQAQVRAIYSIGRDQHHLTEREIEQRSIELFGANPTDLSKKQASDFITSLKTAAVPA